MKIILRIIGRKNPLNDKLEKVMFMMEFFLIHHNLEINLEIILEINRSENTLQQKKGK